jgi:Ca2+:H+ antiporter
VNAFVVPRRLLTRGEMVTIGLAVLASAAAGVLTRAEAAPLLTFGVSAAALALLAMTVGHATEQIGEYLSAGATGVLQASLGNLPELLVGIFSLRAGLGHVVQAALVGSILANLLLVLGLAILIGGVKHGTQRFPSEPPRMVATLLLLAVAALAFPTLAYELHTPASHHEIGLGAACALALLAVFAASLPFFLKADPAVVPARDESHPAGWPLWLAITILALAGVAAALVSEWFVDALTPAMHAIGLSETFAGLVVVAIAGNAVENLVGIQLAAQNKPDYAMSIILTSSLQIALALTPVLVLISFFVGPTPLTLVLPPLFVAALAVAASVTAVIVYDGETIWLEGVALIGLYGIIVSAFWWG